MIESRFVTGRLIGSPIAILNHCSEKSFNHYFNFAQLYKLPGGNQVDGLPPATSLHIRLENPEFSLELEHLRKLSGEF